MSFSRISEPTNEAGIYLHEPRSDPECVCTASVLSEAACSPDGQEICPSGNNIVLLVLLYLLTMAQSKSEAPA